MTLMLRFGMNRNGVSLVSCHLQGTTYCQESQAPLYLWITIPGDSHSQAGLQSFKRCRLFVSEVRGCMLYHARWPPVGWKSKDAIHGLRTVAAAALCCRSFASMTIVFSWHSERSAPWIYTGIMAQRQSRPVRSLQKRKQALHFSHICIPAHLVSWMCCEQYIDPMYDTQNVTGQGKEELVIPGIVFDMGNCTNGSQLKTTPYNEYLLQRTCGLLLSEFSTILHITKSKSAVLCKTCHSADFKNARLGARLNLFGCVAYVSQHSRELTYSKQAVKAVAWNHKPTNL